VIRLSGTETTKVRVAATASSPAPHVLIDSDVDETALSTEGSVTRKAG
jgi:hypothetical protein